MTEYHNNEPLGAHCALMNRATWSDVETREAEGEAERLLGLGDTLAGYDLTKGAEDRGRFTLRMQQLRSLALIRIGAIERAKETLEACLKHDRRNPETLALLARVEKERWRLLSGSSAGDSEEAQQALEHSQQLYQMGFATACEAEDAGQAYYNGINSAALSALLDKQEGARHTAREVLEWVKCAEEHPRPNYWERATAAEANLILGNIDEAEILYRKAVALDSDRIADLVSTRRHARWGLRCLGEPPGRFDFLFPVPKVVAFSGPNPDSTSELVMNEGEQEGLRRRFGETLDDIRQGMPLTLFSTATPGYEIIILEVAAEKGQGINIVLPYDKETYLNYIETKVGIGWADRLQQLLKIAEDVTELTPNGGLEERIHQRFADYVVDGIASLKSDEWETEYHTLTVDGRSNVDSVCNPWIVKHWEDQGRPPLVVNGWGGGQDESESFLEHEPQGETREQSQELAAIIVGDVRGFSQLNDMQLYLFQNTYMKQLGDALHRIGGDDISVLPETAGDGFFVVIPSFEKALGIAFALQQVAVGFTHPDLPSHLGLRLALHAGPVTRHHNSFRRSMSYTGTHACFAARIEPVTPPGEIFASQPFAALARSFGLEGITFDYVGRTEFAKGYGRFPLYRLRNCSTPSK